MTKTPLSLLLPGDGRPESCSPYWRVVDKGQGGGKLLLLLRWLSPLCCLSETEHVVYSRQDHRVKRLRPENISGGIDAWSAVTISDFWLPPPHAVAAEQRFHQQGEIYLFGLSHNMVIIYYLTEMYDCTSTFWFFFYVLINSISLNNVDIRFYLHMKCIIFLQASTDNKQQYIVILSGLF